MNDFKSDIGIIGLATMGKNISLNICRKGYSVSVFNRSYKITELFVKNNRNKDIYPFLRIKDFVFSLKRPRTIMLIIKSGSSIDHVIDKLVPFLEKNDIIIDCSNTFYKDTINRYNILKKIGIYFLDMGISGGEYGALNGLSIMIGGDKEAYDSIYPIIKNIAFRDNKGIFSIVYTGISGTGHYLKMLHNGIEYGHMQIIAESYSLLKNLFKMNNSEIANVFLNWNKCYLKSYLIEITISILNKKTSCGKFLLDMILDKAYNKGTGSFMIKNALDVEEPISLITQSLFVRYLSVLKSRRMLASKFFSGPKINISNNKEYSIEMLKKAFYFTKVILYMQSFFLLEKNVKFNNWNLKISNILRVFHSGCIIRSNLLSTLIDYYFEKESIENILFTEFFMDIIKYHNDLREIVILSIRNGLSLPVFSSAINYYDNYRSAESSANLLQAQRDYFGAHQYERIDKNGFFHTLWNI